MGDPETSGVEVVEEGPYQGTKLYDSFAAMEADLPDAGFEHLAEFGTDIDTGLRGMFEIEGMHGEFTEYAMLDAEGKLRLLRPDGGRIKLRDVGWICTD